MNDIFRKAADIVDFRILHINKKSIFKTDQNDIENCRFKKKKKNDHSFVIYLYFLYLRIVSGDDHQKISINLSVGSFSLDEGFDSRRFYNDNRLIIITYNSHVVRHSSTYALLKFMTLLYIFVCL